MTSQRNRIPLVALFVLLASLYMLVYSGRVESRDANRLFDAVGSIVEWGDLRLDLAMWENPPTSMTVEWFPLEFAGVEPLQVIAAAPLYVLARIIPGIGLVHTVWLFNVLVTAVAGVVVAVYGRSLGYSRGASLLAAVAFGVATAIVPYSKTLFREPLTLLTLLLALLFADRLRASGYRSILLAFALVLSLLALLLTRASAMLAIPALIVLIFPAIRIGRRAQSNGVRTSFAYALPADAQRWRGVLIVGGVVAAVLILTLLLIVFGNAIGTGGRYDVIRRLLEASGQTLSTALHTYLFSVGGSIWGTSPVLLLAIPGMWLLIRQGNWRYPLAILLLIGGFAVGYAIFNNTFWFGGLSWSPRFLIPVIPLALLGAMPIFERVARKPISIWGVVFVVLLIYGIWINLSGVTLTWDAYSAALPAESGGIGEWGPGLNEFAYLRWVVTPTLWGEIPLDIAWSVIEMPVFYGAFGVLAASALVVLVASSTAQAERMERTTQALSLRALRVLPVLLVVGWLMVTAAGLLTLYQRDPRYQPDETAVESLLPLLESETNRDDVILLSSPRYVPFFQNRGKLLDAGRVIALELQYGERVSEAQPALVESEYPPVLVTKEASRFITNLAQTRDRIWLLVDGGADLWWSVRPAERYLSAYYYPVQVITPSPLTRLIEFSTIPAPDPFAFRGAETPTDLQFGESIRLEGVTLPAGNRVAAGDVLGVSLYWTTDAPLESRYTTALYLRDSGGNPVAQTDSPPMNGFAPTDGWIPGAPQWDHKGIRVPEGTPAGTYQLWVKLYDFGADGASRDLPVTAGESLDGVIGVIPITVNVE